MPGDVELPTQRLLILKTNQCHSWLAGWPALVALHRRRGCGDRIVLSHQAACGKAASPAEELGCEGRLLSAPGLFLLFFSLLSLFIFSMPLAQLLTVYLPLYSNYFCHSPRPELQY